MGRLAKWMSNDYRPGWYVTAISAYITRSSIDHIISNVLKLSHVDIYKQTNIHTYTQCHFKYLLVTAFFPFILQWMNRHENHIFHLIYLQLNFFSFPKSNWFVFLFVLFLFLFIVNEFIFMTLCLKIANYKMFYTFMYRFFLLFLLLLLLLPEWVSCVCVCRIQL